MSMTEEVIIRMREAYQERLGEDWSVTYGERRDWTFSLRCEKNGFVKFSSWLREDASVHILISTANRDCASILRESEQQKVN